MEQFDVAVSNSQYEAVRGNYARTDKMVCFTFDYMGNPNARVAVLDILKQRNIHATFFLTGSSVPFPYVERMLEDGHELGNHSMNHYDMRELSAQNNSKEITLENELCARLWNYDLHLFRPPSGAHNRIVDTVSLYHGMEVIMWAIDAKDWREDYSVNAVVNVVLNHIKPGDIILMHPNAKTKGALPIILDELTEQGYTFGTVSELMEWQSEDDKQTP